MRWPAVGSLLRMRRLRRAPAGTETAPPADPRPPAPEPVQEDDLLRRVSDIAWRSLLIGVVIALLLWALAYLSVISVPVILAVFLTALLMPLTNWLRRKGLSRGPSTAVTLIGAVVVLGGVITLVVQPALSGFGGLFDSVGQAFDDITGIATMLGLQPELVSMVMSSADAELSSLLSDNREQLMTGVWTAGTAVLEVLLGLVLILVLTVYFVHSGDRLIEWLQGLFPTASRRPMKAATDLAYGVMGRYVRGVATVGVFDAVGIAVPLFFLIDPSLVVPLVFLTFIGAFLPIVGAFASGVLAAVVAFVTEGPLTALFVIAAVLIVQQLESHIFAPRVYGRALDLPAAVVLIAISAGGIIGGIAGMFLATPVAAVVAALLRDRPFSREEHHQDRAPAGAPLVTGGESTASAERSTTGAALTTDPRPNPGVA